MPNVPLPSDTKATWPPPALGAVLQDIREADAWWTGDPKKLTEFYGYSADPEQRRPSLLRLWGNKRPDVKPVERVHAPIASDIAATGADLLFGDDLTVTMADAHSETPKDEAKNAEARLLEIWDQATIATVLLEGAEVCGGLGGVYLRPTWDQTVADHPLIDVIHADHAVPEWRGDRLYAVTFWSTIAIETTTHWRHLERHEPGMILHGLYAGDATHLGSRVKLDRQPATAGLLDQIDTSWWTGILPGYVPNVRPNRRHRGLPIGRSDTQGQETFMDALDLTMTSWAKDIRLGQRRVIVPGDFLQKAGRGSGAWFDQDQEVFSPIDVDPSADKSPGITLVDFAIRAADHLATATELYQQVASSAGYSPQSFGMQGDGAAITATEVSAHEGLSERTTGRKQRYWRPQVARAGEALLAIDSHVFKRPTPVLRPTVEFPDRSQADMPTMANTLNLIGMAQAASIETKVRMLHPEWEKPQVDAEVAAIKAEQGLAADPTGGLP